MHTQVNGTILLKLRNSFLVVQWVSEGHVAKFYGRLWLIRSVLKASKFSVLDVLEILILWVYYTIPFGFSLLRHFWDIIFSFWNHSFWPRIADESSLPEIRILFIFVIKSDFKWCIYRSRSLYLYSGFKNNILFSLGNKMQLYVVTLYMNECL